MRGTWAFLVLIGCETPPEKPPVVVPAHALSEVDAGGGPRFYGDAGRPILLQCVRHSGGATGGSKNGVPILGECNADAECSNGGVGVTCKDGACECHITTNSGGDVHEPFRFEEPCSGQMTKLLTERCMAGMPPVLNPAPKGED